MATIAELKANYEQLQQHSNDLSKQKAAIDGRVRDAYTRYELAEGDTAKQSEIDKEIGTLKEEQKTISRQASKAAMAALEAVTAWKNAEKDSAN